MCAETYMNSYHVYFCDYFSDSSTKRFSTKRAVSKIFCFLFLLCSNLLYYIYFILKISRKNKLKKKVVQKKRIQLLKIYKNMKKRKKRENGKKLMKFNLCAGNLQ
jgi:hypothetical protein